MHVFGSKQSQYGVVWWDPTQLRLGAEPSFGIRRQDLIGKEVDRKVVEADLKAYEDWRSQRNDAIARGSTPSLVVRTVKEQGTLLGEGRPEVQLIEIARNAARPAGPRYGSLVHAVLATVPLDADRERLEQVTQLQGRILGATPDEVASTVDVAVAALAHPLMERARFAASRGQCRRETPVTLREADGSLVEGVVDLAFLDDGTWTVVDFKTDRELASALPAYQRQVDIYAEAIASATGRKTVAVLMRV
jgi:ATP-dependent exoDNAse (exonuclease V) beta subunit